MSWGNNLGENEMFRMKNVTPIRMPDSYGVFILEPAKLRVCQARKPTLSLPLLDLVIRTL